MDEEPAVTVEELAERADEYLHDQSLTPEEYEALKRSVAELAPIFTTERACFVLGSYGKSEIRRLQLVKDRLNRRANTYAFLMVDVRSEWTNTYVKFRVLADYTDLIVGVAEHARGGFLVEQGYFTALEEYFTKTYVFERDYDALAPDDLDTDVDPEHPYSGMQTSIFDMLANAGRLCKWVTEDDLVDCTDGLPRALER
ncbi:hypothetical protein [Halomarina pelagica]|uniref:hypothetical protein n=1 Tax=Halomarina pelagica TaxID=2961599 RepID=UPI0020C22FDA|nr:hypothetical protein [Halomarina sp. BND7]